MINVLLRWRKTTCVKPTIVDNQAVQISGRLIGGLLCLALAGCSSIPNERARVSDWSIAPEPVQIEPGPSPVVAPEPMPVARDIPEPVIPPVETKPIETRPPEPVKVEKVVTVPAWVSLGNWCHDEGLAGPIRQATDAGAVYTIGAGDQGIRLMPGNRLVRWQGIDVHLGYPPQVVKGEVALYSLDLQKTVFPLTTQTPRIAPTAPPVIVIDPGHGGMDGGAGTKATGLEKNYTLDWARRVAALLTNAGWQVVLTRTNDMDLPLPDRLAIADQHAASVFVSLHFNSAGSSREQSGLETYCLTPTGLPSAMTRGFADDLAVEFPNNNFDTDNVRLACTVHRELLKSTRLRDRGVRRARFLGILRGQQRPAILVEGGYLTNPTEARQIADPKYRQVLASAVARGIVAWMGPPVESLAAVAPAAKPVAAPTARPLEPQISKASVQGAVTSGQTQ